MKNLPKTCPKCNENLTDEHVKALSDAYLFIKKFPGLVEEVTFKYYCCGKCWES